MERFNAGTTFDNRFETNVNLSDSADYSMNTTSALTVSMVGHVSLRVSLQWLYENEPALESDLDVIAFVKVIDPTGFRARATSSSGHSHPARRNSSSALPTRGRTSWIPSSRPRLSSSSSSPW